MDKKSKFFIGFFFVASIFVMTLLFCRFYIQRDYFVKGEVACNPQTEKCFVRSCSEGCEADAAPDYYKIRTVRAYELPVCDPHVGECPEVDCATPDSCSEELCTEENVPEGENCSNSEDLPAPGIEEEGSGDASVSETAEDSESIGTVE